MCASIRESKYVNSKTFANLLTIAAAAGLTLSPMAVAAQDAAPPTDALGLPTNATILGNASPDVRVATAVVNGHVITGTDIDQRVALLLAANEQQVSEEELNRVRMQVLRNLIDETLQIQAAEAQEMPVSGDDVNRTYARVAAQNFGQNPQAMDAYLESVGSSPTSLKRQIMGELAWQRLLGRNIAPFVNVSEEEVNEVLKRLEQDRGTEEFRLGEIFLAATPENAAQVETNARQFSQASTAAVGGDLGWVRLGQLPGELSTAAASMQPGQLVGPLTIPGGYSILLLIDKRQVLMADPRDAVLSLKQISIGFPENLTQAQFDAEIARFNAGVQAIKGCGDADSAAAAMGADIVTNNEIRARSLPDQLQALVLNLQIGQATQPFGTVDDGVRVLMLCGRDDPEASGGPDFNQMMNQLEDERVNKRAQRYLRDLRNDAYIEYN